MLHVLMLSVLLLCCGCMCWCMACGGWVWVVGWCLLVAFVLLAGASPVWTIMGGNGCTLANADAIGHGVAALLVDWMCCGLLVLAMGWLCSM